MKERSLGKGTFFIIVMHGKREGDPCWVHSQPQAQETICHSSAGLLQAILVSAAQRSETASSCSELGQPCRGMVTSPTCGRVLLESPWLRASGHMPNSSFPCSGFLLYPEGISPYRRVSQRKASKESPTSAQRLARQKVKSTSKEMI